MTTTTEDKKVEQEEKQKTVQKPKAAVSKSTAESGAGEEVPKKKKTTRTKKEPKPKKEGKMDIPDEEPEVPTGPQATEGQEQDLMVEFSIEIKKEQFEAGFNETVEKYASDVKIPGFRKGKVPIEVIKSRLKDAINDDVVNKLLQEAIYEKIQKDNLKVISRPEVRKLDFEEGKDIKADVVVEVLPEVTLPDLETLEVEIPAKDLESPAFDEKLVINHILESNRRQVPVTNREIKENDMVILKYQSKILATKRMTPRKDANYRVVKGGSFEIIDLFDDIIGKNINDDLTLKRTYPEDYKKKPWAGNEIEHYIHIERIFEMVKPELDEAFIKSQGFKDEEEFKKKLKEEHQIMAERTREDKKVAAIIEKLNNAVQFPLPKSLVDQEIGRMIQQNPYQFSMKDAKSEEAIIEALRGNAEKSVRFSFITDAVKREFKLEVTAADLENEYKRLAESNQLDIKEIRKYYLKKENKEYMEDAILRNKVMDLLKEKIKIKEV